MNLREIGEDRLLARLMPAGRRSRNVLVAAGDDCAVVRSGGELLLLKTDCVVEGIHFSKRDDAAAVGWKAMMRPLSDFAAMSGVPQFALVTLVVPPARTVRVGRKALRRLAKSGGQVRRANRRRRNQRDARSNGHFGKRDWRGRKRSLGFSQRRQSRGRIIRYRKTGRLHSRPALVFRPAHRGSALVDEKFSPSMP